MSAAPNRPARLPVGRGLAVGRRSLLAGCDSSLSDSPGSRDILESGRTADLRAPSACWSRRTALAREFTEADISPDFKANGIDRRRTTTTTGRLPPTASPTGGWRSTGSSSSRSSSASPICAPCRRAPRSRGMTASRAGAASANGPARRWEPLLDKAELKPAGALHRVPLRRRSEQTARRRAANITRASTWSTPFIRRPSSPTT